MIKTTVKADNTQIHIALMLIIVKSPPNFMKNGVINIHHIEHTMRCPNNSTSAMIPIPVRRRVVLFIPQTIMTLNT